MNLKSNKLLAFTIAVSLTGLFSIAAAQGPLTVDVTPAGSGRVTRDLNQAAYPPGTTVNLTAEPKPGYQFKRWTGSATGTESTIRIVTTGHMKVTAVFEKIQYEPISKVTKGDIIPFGKYKWRVLDVQNDTALIVTEEIIEQRRFDEHSDKWASSEIRRYLNNEFYNTFSADEKKLIADVNDRIILLSLNAAGQYFSNDSERALGSLWWLRSYSPHNPGYVYCVRKDGMIGPYYSHIRDTIGVRPALWLRIDSNVSQPQETPKAAAAKQTNEPSAIIVEKMHDDIPDPYRLFFADGKTDEKIVFYIKEEVKNFAYIEITHSEDGDGNIALLVGKILYDAGDLYTKMSVAVSVSISEGIPTRGIRFSRKGSALRYFYLSESGMDGSISLSEFRPQN
jgi:uncharacterized repeat protein (TIGR02543 family)